MQKPLTAKQKRFVAEYVVDLNATQAAIRAGYSKKTANVAGPRLLSNVRIADEIAKKNAKIESKLEVSAERVLQEIARLAFADPRKMFDDNGNLIPIHQLDADTAATIGGFEVVSKSISGGEQEVEHVHKFKVWDKNVALDKLAKNLGLFEKDNDQRDINITISGRDADCG